MGWDTGRTREQRAVRRNVAYCSPDLMPVSVADRARGFLQFVADSDDGSCGDSDEADVFPVMVDTAATAAATPQEGGENSSSSSDNDLLPPRQTKKAPSSAAAAPPAMSLYAPPPSQQQQQRRPSSSDSGSSSSSDSDSDSDSEGSSGTSSESTGCAVDKSLKKQLDSVLHRLNSAADKDEGDPGSTGHRLDLISDAAKVYFDDSKLTAEQAKRRGRFFLDLCRRAQQVFPQGHLVLFGSSATGLCHRSSDLDVTLLISGVDPQNALKRLRAPIARMSRVQFIKSARVPILKCVGKSTPYQFDISCNRPEGSWNAQVIKQFIDFDPRVAPALFYLHELLDKAGIKNSRLQLLSAFSINISFIYYLQAIAAPSVLPHFLWTVPCTTNGIDDVTLHAKQYTYLNPGTNDTALAGLLLGYLDWFHTKVKHSMASKREVWVDIRQPGDARSVTPSSFAEPGIAMVNPVDGSHNVTCNIKKRQWTKIHQYMERILRRLCGGEVVDAAPSAVGRAVANGIYGVVESTTSSGGVQRGFLDLEDDDADADADTGSYAKRRRFAADYSADDASWHRQWAGGGRGGRKNNRGGPGRRGGFFK